ncbi:spore coat protein [Haloimpatiens sp. FM7315]|uniref:spore coat protein n=1 Tax=Haloimpatiens sp. FM7315 TaxID=3298609 RepID=UPI0035A36E43
MQKKIFRTVEDYILSKDIDIVNHIPFDKKDFSRINSKTIIEQLKLISKFHKRIKNCNRCTLQRIENQTGKIVELQKVDLGKCKKILRDIENSNSKNDFESMLVNYGKEFLRIGEKSIEEIYISGYIDIIVRSMDNNEICIGDPYFNNLAYENNRIQIKNINKISYNIVEIDAFNLLNKLSRKGIKLPISYLAGEFCEFEGLGEKSQKLIEALMKYPYDFVRYCNRYKKNKKYDNDKCVEKLKDIMNIYSSEVI